MYRYPPLAVVVLALTLGAACSAGRSERLTACRADLECAPGRCIDGECELPPAVEESEVLAAAAARGAPVLVESQVEGGGRCAESACSVLRGATVTFTAPDEPGYRFTGWSGDGPCSGSEQQLVLRDVAVDTQCLANYVARGVVRGEVEDGVGLVAAQAESAAALCSGAGCEVDRGEVVQLSAPERSGYRFVGFRGAGCGDSAGGPVLPVVATEGEIVCNAQYARAVVVSAKAEGADATLVASSEHGSARCELASCELDVGAAARLSAPTVPRTRFVGWTGAAACLSEQPLLDLPSVDSDLTCTAQYLPRFVVSGSAQGADPLPELSASSEDTFASCEGPRCELDRLGSAALFAPTVPGFRLRGWLGDDCAAESAASVTLREVDHDVTCTADYVRGVAVSGAVRGANASVVASSLSPGALCAGATCSLDEGGTVTLVAPAVVGHSFTGFSGDPGCSSALPTVTLADIDSSKTCLASYTRTRLDVVGSIAPAGAGTVEASSTSGTATCAGARCSVDHGAPARLQARAAPGYVFAGWSGCMTAVTPTLTLASVTAALSCRANFERQRFTVTAVAGSGGTVEPESAAPAAVCGKDSCTVDYDGEVVLTARAAAGYRFSGWSGCSSATAAALTLSEIRADQRCSANFVARVRVAVSALPLAGGTASVRSISVGASCTSTGCTVDAGAMVALTASPATASGYEFVSWSGCSSATTRTLTLSAAADSSCVANFRLRTVGVTRASNASAIATVTYPVPYGGSLTLRAPATPPGYDYFDYWMGCAVDPLSETTVRLTNLTEDVTCRAVYGRVR